MDIEFGQVLVPSGFDEVVALRRQAYARHHNNVLSFEVAQDTLLDECGRVFLAREHDSPVATARITVLGEGVTKTERFRELPDACRRPQYCEISRLAVIRQSSRQSMDARHFLMVGAQWLMANTEIRHVVGHCKEALLKRYIALGAQVISGPLRLATSVDAYYLIRASIADTAQLGARIMPLERVLSLDQPDCHKAVNWAD